MLKFERVAVRQMNAMLSGSFGSPIIYTLKRFLRQPPLGRVGLRIQREITHRQGATRMIAVLSTLRSSRKLPHQLAGPRDGRTEKP